MLISDSHRFIFVQVRKTASTSMQSVLRKYAIDPPRGRLARLKSKARLDRNYRKRVFRSHEEIRVAERLMPEAMFREYFKFAFVRNPWSQLVGEYELLMRDASHGRHQRVRQMGSFTEFIEMQIGRRRAHQINMLTGKQGNLVMDFIGRFENLQSDWRRALEQAGLPFEPLPHENRNQVSIDYRTYFTPRDVDLVERHWHREIGQFGYRFGD